MNLRLVMFIFVGDNRALTNHGGLRQYQLPAVIGQADPLTCGVGKEKSALISLSTESTVAAVAVPRLCIWPLQYASQIGKLRSGCSF
jgi:hypothetical protein